MSRETHALACLAFAVVTLVGGRAEAARSARLIYVRGHGADTCPDEDAVRNAVAARLGYDPFVAFAANILVAHVRREGDGFHTAVGLVDENGVERGARQLTVDSRECADAIAAMALTISIAIDPLSLTGPPQAATDAARIAQFRAIFTAEFDYVWSSLRRLGVQGRDLEDVTQNIFLEVFRQQDRYDPARPIRPWLFAFAFRFASDYRRLVRHRVEVFDDRVERISVTVPADEALVAHQARTLIAEALESIDLVRRAVFILHELDEVPMIEIAQSLDIPLNTAYSRLRVARDEFTAAIRRLQLQERGR